MGLGGIRIGGRSTPQVFTTTGDTFGSRSNLVAPRPAPNIGVPVGSTRPTLFGESNPSSQQELVRTDVGVVVFNPQTNQFERPLGISAGDFNPRTGGYSDAYLERQEEEQYARDLARRQEERADLFDTKLEQEARQRDVQAGVTQSDAFRGLLGLYDSFGLGRLNDQVPFRLSDRQIGELDAYITGALRSGDFTRDDLFGFRRDRDDSLRRDLGGSGFGEYVLGLIGSNRNDQYSRQRQAELVDQMARDNRSAGIVTQRGDSLFGSNGRFLGSAPGFEQPSISIPQDYEQRQFNLATFPRARPGTFFGS